MGRLLICFMMKRWNILKALYIKLLQYHNTLTDTRLEWQERLITVDVPVYEKGLCVWTLEKSEHQMRLHYQMSSWCTLTEKDYKSPLVCIVSLSPPPTAKPNHLPQNVSIVGYVVKRSVMERVSLELLNGWIAHQGRMEIWRAALHFPKELTHMCRYGCLCCCLQRYDMFIYTK